jgi:hypothetical protein
VRGTKERLYSKDKKRGRAGETTKEVTRLLKSMEKQKSNPEKSRKQSTAPAPTWRRGSQNHTIR